jgi:hypothetical protein
MLGAITQWFVEHQQLIQQIGNISLVALGITVVALPLVVARLPEDYFVNEKREPIRQAQKHPFLWSVICFGKNLLGVFLILIGIAMLVLPGQGTVTILIGLAVSNFPGKFSTERRIVSQHAVGATLNRIRKLAGAPPLSMPTAT